MLTVTCRYAPIVTSEATQVIVMAEISDLFPRNLHEWKTSVQGTWIPGSIFKLYETHFRELIWQAMDHPGACIANADPVGRSRRNTPLIWFGCILRWRVKG